MNTLIIQQITSEWTKAPRGGHAAEARNRVSESLSLPAVLEPGRILHHYAIFAESSAFRGEELVREFDSQTRHDLGLPLKLKIVGDLLTVDFCWSRRHCGAPERPSHRLFGLRIGEMGRVVYNGRFNKDWDASEWTYHKTVVNMVLANKQVRRDFFLEMKPQHEVRKMARLK